MVIYEISFCKSNNRRNLLKFLLFYLFLLFSETMFGQEPVIKNTATESPEEYFAAILQTVAASGAIPRDIDLPLGEPYDNDAYILLQSCNGPGSFGMSDDPDWYPTMLAMRLIEYNISLRNLKIPPNVTSEHLQTLSGYAVEYIRVLRHSGALGNNKIIRNMDDRINQLIEQEEERLLISVKNYVKTQSSNSPEIMTREGCGAGETEVVIRTEPVGAKVAYITEFKHMLCEVRNLDPYDSTACSGWIDAVKDVEYLSGKYVYVANWPDGKSTSGRFNMSDPWESEDGYNQVITIKP